MGEGIREGLRPFLRLLKGGLKKKKGKAWAPCPECAEPHNPEEVHDAEGSVYRARFHMRHGRFPAWQDAFAHCSEELQLDYVLELVELGVPVESDPCK